MAFRRACFCISLFLIPVFASRASKPASASSPRTTVSPSVFANQEFDVVIIGGGNAGLVLANRLSAPSRCASSTTTCPRLLRVGVIEAGPHRPGDPLIEVPTAGNLLGNANVGMLIGGEYDWKFQSIPQGGLSGARIQYPRGKVLGGSTAIHSMVWQRGSSADYDAWAYDFENGPDWSFDGMLPYLRRSESYAAGRHDTPPLASTGAEKTSLESLRKQLDVYHGCDGPVQISYNSYQTALEHPASLSLLNALSDRMNLTFHSNHNPDGGDDVSVPLFGTSRSVSPITGLRSHAAAAYLDLASGVWDRPNLSVVTGAVATQILFEGKTARAVTFISETDGTTYKAYIAEAGEVILSAGAIQSPQLLELSGIGNRTRLEALGINVIVDLPEVGENLQDHPVTLSDFAVKEGVETLDWLALNQTHTQLHKQLFETSRTGALTYTAPLLAPIPLQALTSPAEYTTLRAELDSSIMQLGKEGKLTPMQRTQYDVLRRFADEGDVGWVEMVLVPSGGVLSEPLPGKGGATVVAIQLYPFSRGSIHINSTDPLVPPLIDPNFLPREFPWDSHVLLAGSKFVRDWFSTEPIADLISTPIYPPADLATEDTKRWAEFMRSAVRTTNHPLGTTAMAPRRLGGVVDSSLRVYGLDNVRVVDAGIIPLTVGVATQPTVYALAEKASDIIRHEWGLDKDTCMARAGSSATLTAGAF